MALAIEQVYYTGCDDNKLAGAANQIRPWPKEQIECQEIPVGEKGETSLIAEGNRHALDY